MSEKKKFEKNKVSLKAVEDIDGFLHDADSEKLAYEIEQRQKALGNVSKKSRPTPPAVAPVDRKLCVKCHTTYPLDEFHRNRYWEEQQGYDVWCKKCVEESCEDETTLREFAFYNNRQYIPELYEDSRVKALYKLSQDGTFNSPRTRAETRDKMVNKEACLEYISMMNKPIYYKFYNNVQFGSPMPKFDAGVYEGVVRPPEEEIVTEPKEYSKKWYGYYTKTDIEYLDDFLERLMERIPDDDISRIDYAKKMCRASLEADNAFAAYRENRGSRADWEKAMSVYDMLSKSAAFAESSRKKEAAPVTDASSLSEFILSIEETGKLVTASPDYFPEDNVDKVYRQFMHTLKAIRGTHAVETPEQEAVE